MQTRTAPTPLPGTCKATLVIVAASRTGLDGEGLPIIEPPRGATYVDLVDAYEDGWVRESVVQSYLSDGTPVFTYTLTRA